MAARVSLVSRKMFSCSVLPSLRTICTSFRQKAQPFDNKMTKQASHNIQASQFSSCSIKVRVWKDDARTVKCQLLVGQPLRLQSIYPLDCAAVQYVKQTNQLSHKSCSAVTTRWINTKSKLGKRKTCKAVAKRFLRTGKGKLKRWRAGKNHKMMHKGPKRSRHLRKPTYVNKQQLKLLNKMLNGW